MEPLSFCVRFITGCFSPDRNGTAEAICLVSLLFIFGVFIYFPTESLNSNPVKKSIAGIRDLFYADIV